MNVPSIFLTKSTMPIVNIFAEIMGKIMEVMFMITSRFGVVNIGLSIILFTVIVNILMWPMTLNQQKSSRMMSIMQPELQAIQKKYKNKRDNASMARMQAETKAVYDKYGTSMSGSCLFLAIQMPILFALYQVIYHIPGYVGAVRDVLEAVANPVMQQSNYLAVLTEIGAKIAPKLPEQEASLDLVVDFLYKFTPSQWSALEAQFPAIAGVISENSAQIIKMNTFLVNLSAAPFQGFTPNAAWVLPFLAAAVQWYSTKLMTAGSKRKGSQNDDNPMAQQMETMNTMMPLMSLFFCFTLPSGIGLYWVASGLCRMIQQMIINAQLDKMDIDEIVAKNVEKANQKAIREGKNPQAVKTSTDKLLRDVKSREESEEKAELAMRDKIALSSRQVKDSTAYYNKNAKPGSLASRANMVALYDEKKAEEKKRNRKASVTEEAAPKAEETAEKTVNTAEEAAAPEEPKQEN